MDKTAYILTAAKAARLTSIQLHENTAKSKLRLARATAYAEWRWAGYQDGKISGL